MERPFFHASCRLNEKLRSAIRRFTAEFYRRVLADHEVSEKASLATHELLENSFAYASDGETGVRIDLAEDLLTIKTWNRTSPDRLESLRVAIERMNRELDPGRYYQGMLDGRANGSGLGLARVRAQADMNVAYAMDAGRVCISATGPLRGRRAAL